MWLVSSEGGQWPKWSADGNELFFRGIDRLEAVWSAQVATESSFQHDAPVRLFTGNYLRANNAGGAFDVSKDGTRFLLTRNDSSSTSTESSITHLVAIDNWFEELRRLAPPDPQ